MSRRGFIATSAGALAGLTVGRMDAQDPRIDRLGPIGLQLYTVRNMMKANVATTLAAVAGIGYREVEFAGYFGHPAKQITNMLSDSGLTSPSAHVDMADLGDKWGALLDDANTLGQKYLIVPWIDASERTLDGYRKIAERFNAAGTRARAEGIRFGYHNHSYEFAPIDGRIPYEILLNETDPANVVMEADIFWMRTAGQDPLTWFAKHPGRFHMLHIKDMAPGPKKEMADVGSGIIDWRAILSRQSQAGVRHVFVEHDEPRNPLASIRNSYRYLRDLTF